MYYTTNEKAKIVRISKSKLEKDLIVKLFEDAHHDLPIRIMKLLPLDEQKAGQFRIELDYFDMDRLGEELNSFSDKKILQKFISPKNGKNRKLSLTRTSSRCSGATGSAPSRGT